jgi:hypothetical protein
MNQKKTDRYLLNVTLTILLLYNILFFVARHAPGMEGTGIDSFQLMMKSNIGIFTILEAIGVITLFVDLIGRFDSFQQPTKTIRAVAVSLLVVGLLFKLFINYLDSAYLESSIIEVILIV